MKQGYAILKNRKEKCQRELVCQAERKIDLRPYLIWVMPTEGL